jgi:hypothetical protein
VGHSRTPRRVRDLRTVADLIPYVLHPFTTGGHDPAKDRASCRNSSLPSTGRNLNRPFAGQVTLSPRQSGKSEHLPPLASRRPRTTPPRIAATRPDARGMPPRHGAPPAPTAPRSGDAHTRSNLTTISAPTDGPPTPPRAAEPPAAQRRSTHPAGATRRPTPCTGTGRRARPPAAPTLPPPAAATTPRARPRWRSDRSGRSPCHAQPPEATRSNDPPATTSPTPRARRSRSAAPPPTAPAGPQDRRLYPSGSPHHSRGAAPQPVYQRKRLGEGDWAGLWTCGWDVDNFRRRGGRRGPGRG